MAAQYRHLLTDNELESIDTYNNQYNHTIPDDMTIIVRLDGKGFSKFTKRLKPRKIKDSDSIHLAFDRSFSDAMIDTARDLMQVFNNDIVTAYTHSDEITVILGTGHQFNGVLDILSISNIVSVRFTLNLIARVKENKNLYGENVLKHYTDMFSDTYSGGYFDARILAIPSDKLDDIIKHQRWRSMYDSYRNAVNQYARYMFSTNQLLNKSNKTMINMMREKGFDYDRDVPMSIRYGTYLKKILLENKMTIDARSFLIHNQQCSLVPFLAKYWNDCESEPQLVTPNYKITKEEGEALGDVMKVYEAQYDASVNGDATVIIHMNGKNFGALTRKLKEPYDKSFSLAMVDTVRYLIRSFSQIVTGYTHSDEITIVIGPNNHIYDGRVLKLITLIQSAAAVNLVINLIRRVTQNKNEYSDDVYKYYTDIGSDAYKDVRFTSKIWEIPPDKLDFDLITYFRWRSMCVCYHNAKNDMPMYMKYGVYLKKMLVGKIAENKLSGKKEDCVRTIIDARSFVINDQQCLRDLFLAKYWNGYVQQIVREQTITKKIVYVDYPEIEFTQF